MKLNELEDIPIKDYKRDSNGVDYGKVTKPKQEISRSTMFSVHDYNLKKGKLSASNEKALDKKVDAFLDSTKNRMSMVYNYSSDGLTAFIVYYDKATVSLDSSSKNQLKAKMEEFAKKYSTEKTPTKDMGSGIKNNIQKALETLSTKSLQDLDKYIIILQNRDKYAK